MSLTSQPESQLGQAARIETSMAPLEDRRSIIDLWRVLMKRRIMIIAVTVIVFAMAAVYVFRTKPVYESVSRIEINPNTAPNVGLQSLIQQAGGGQDSTELQTEALILQSDSVLLQTALMLDLGSALRAAKGEKNTHSKAASPTEISPWERQFLINAIREGLKVQIIAGTQIIEIRYRNTDPRLGMAIINKMVDTYIDADLQSKFDRTSHVSSWLQKQLVDLKQEAADAQGRLAEYEKQHNIVGGDETTNLTLSTLDQISSEFETTAADRIMKEARMREYDSKDLADAALMSDNPELTNLRAQLVDLKTQRAELTTRVGPRHPKIRQLDAQISKVETSIESEVTLARRQVAGEYAGALRQEQLIRKRLEAQKEDAYHLNEGLAQYSILRHEAELNRDLYDALLMRLKEASVTAGLSATDITVIDRAALPLIPVAPRKSMSLALGLFGGFLLGAVLAFMIESIDDTLQTSEEVESISMLASLATIPHILSGSEVRPLKETSEAPLPAYALQLTTLRNPKSNAAEAYRGLRSALLLSSIDKPPQTIILTSAYPGEGKTTTAVNLAIVLAQRGERVLLVDADLRRGTLDRVLQIESRNFGLSSVLTQPEEAREMPAPFAELPTFHVLPTGPRPPNPAEMLSSHRMEEQMRQWTREFDRIVFDTAPLLAVSDTQAMATLVDSVILVSRAGVTRKRALIRSRDLLLRINAPVSGVVVNDVDMRLENFYTTRYGMYGYNYGYKYRYGRSYSDKAYGFEDDERGE
jgi:polysaccharide biosynthesis transport protein